MLSTFQGFQILFNVYLTFKKYFLACLVAHKYSLSMWETEVGSW